MFPSPAFRLVAVDADPERVAGVVENGSADEAHVGFAGSLELAPASFDVVLYRLVLHHIAFQGPLGPLLPRGGAAAATRAARWWRSSRGCGTRSASRSRPPTAPTWRRACTGRPTTSRSPRAG